MAKKGGLCTLLEHSMSNPFSDRSANINIPIDQSEKELQKERSNNVQFRCQLRCFNLCTFYYMDFHP